MEIRVLDEEDVFEIAYLTMRGWTCNRNYWMKGSHDCDRETAFAMQLELDEKVSNVGGG